ncbi:MAG: hypothetical protein IPL39_03625 [Opitutaceae bacterium]|nr:hypothetical protein [Opitutaceae bacterium]
MKSVQDETSLIIGTGVGYKAPHVRVFAQSLQKTGFKGRTVIMTGDLPDSEIRQMEEWGVTVLPLSRFPGAFSRQVALKLMAPRARPLRSKYWLLRYLPLPSRLKTRLLSRIGVHYHHIACSRFMYYWDYLDQHPKVERILLADVRDVHFQTDLFAEDWAPGLHVSLEDARGSIGRGEYNNDDPTFDYRGADGLRLHGVNAHWIRTTHGDAVVSSIQDKTICCSGVTFGDRPSIMKYLAAMVAELSRLTPTINEGAGFDQGVHNVLLHTGRLPYAIIHPNDAGPVFTAHAVADHELPVDANNVVRRKSGLPFSVVHQYDRSPKLNALLGK